MKLTKQKAIEEHRKLWNWIADQFESGVEDFAFNLKQMYCNVNGFNINNHCFCCEYTTNINEQINELNYENCRFCPLVWGTENELDDYFCENNFEDPFIRGLWSIVSRYSGHGQYAEAARIAREIANLPERPDENFDILDILF